MRLSTVFTVLLIASVSAQTFNIHDLTKKMATIPKSLLKETREITYCGTYSMECTDRVTTNVQILGMTGKTPIYLGMPSTAYAQEGCVEGSEMLRGEPRGELEPPNGDKKTLKFTFEDYLVTFFIDPAQTGVTCEGIVIGEPASVMKFTCKDDQGDDPFQTYRDMIGVSGNIDFEFTEDSVTLVGEVSKTFKKESDDGCHHLDVCMK